LQLIGFDALTIVGDADRKAVGIFDPGPQLHVAVIAGELNGVDQQVGNDLPQFAGIAEDIGQLLGHFEAEANVIALGLPVAHGTEMSHDFAQPGGAAPDGQDSRPQPTDIEHVVDHAGQVVGPIGDELGGVALLIGSRTA
jgi:hypothetical protein